MGKSHLRNFALRIIGLSAVENGFGRCRIVEDETYRALAILKREGLKCENVDTFHGESLAELSKCSRLIFESDGELLHGRHNGTSSRCASGTGWAVPARFSVARNPTPRRWTRQGAHVGFRRKTDTLGLCKVKMSAFTGGLGRDLANNLPHMSQGAVRALSKCLTIQLSSGASSNGECPQAFQVENSSYIVAISNARSHPLSLWREPVGVLKLYPTRQ